MISIRPITLIAVCAAMATLASSAVGCGSPPTPTTPAPAGSDTAAPAASSAAPTPAAGPVWKADASKDEQIAFMKTYVAPRMGKVFQAHDASRYADFSCKTCHGPAFKEPKAFLPHLTLKDGKMTAFAEKPEVAKWMHETVVPEMASAMGMKPYDMATKQGFGCGGCHAIDMK